MCVCVCVQYLWKIRVLASLNISWLLLWCHSNMLSFDFQRNDMYMATHSAFLFPPSSNKHAVTNTCSCQQPNRCPKKFCRITQSLKNLGFCSFPSSVPICSTRAQQWLWPLLSCFAISACLLRHLANELPGNLHACHTKQYPREQSILMCLFVRRL